MIRLTRLLSAWLVGLLPSFAEERTFDSAGVKIRYVTEGSGEAVVLIHGWLADSTMWGRDWLGNTKLDYKSAPGFRLIAIDCRGHGKSGKPHEQEMYGAEMANDIVRLLDHLKIEKTHLISYSMGAFIAGHFAANHPERVISVQYGGQSPIIENGQKATGSASEVEIFAKAVEEGKGLGPWLIAVTPAGKPKPTPTQANALTKLMFMGKDTKALAAAGLTFNKLAVKPEQLSRCKAPTLFIHGEKEAEYIHARVAAARKLLPHSQLVLVEGEDHITTLANPKYSTTVVKFLKEHRLNPEPSSPKTSK